MFEVVKVLMNGLRVVLGRDRASNAREDSLKTGGEEKISRRLPVYIARAVGNEDAGFGIA